MDTRLILLKSVILLYRENQLSKKENGSHALVQEIMSIVKGPKAQLDNDFGRDVISYLRNTVIWMLETPFTEKFDRKDIIMRVKVGANGDDFMSRMIEEGTYDAHEDPDVELINAEIQRIRREFSEHIKKHHIRKIMHEAHTRIAYNPESVDWKHCVREIRSLLEPYETMYDEEDDHPSLVTGFSLSDVSKMTKVLSLAKSQQTLGSSTRYGWKGFNRMFGRAGGSRRGEFIVVPALQHNFKSGFTLMTMGHHAKYNYPVNISPEEEKRKPLLLRISYENDSTVDILTLYKFLYEAEYEEEVDIDAVDPGVAAAYVSEVMGRNGWDVMIQRYDPTNFTINDLCFLLDDLMAKGYEIHCVWIDYLAMMSKAGCTQGPAGTEFRDLTRRTRNYGTRHHITIITPWQISTEGKMKIREGSADFLAEIVGKGYYDSCRTIDQEVDMEIYIHIYKVKEGESWLGIRRGKHRKFDITPEADMSCYLPFSKVGTLKEDVLTDQDYSRRKLTRGILDMDDSTLWD